MFDHVIVLLDGSTRDHETLRYAITEADRHHSALVLMRVIPCPEPLADDAHGHGGPAPCMASPPDPDLRQDRIHAERDLRDIARWIDHSRVVDVVCEIGEPYRRIARRVRRWRRPLLVIGHGEGLDHHPLGPAVRRLILEGSVDVLVVHDGQPARDVGLLPDSPGDASVSA